MNSSTIKHKTMNNLTMDQKIKQSTILRGICQSIESMSLPLFDNLDAILKKFGYKLTKLDEEK